jgi:glycosyltransferase involved in cell wall biosynthesis
MELVSIIIPVYNTEKYIVETIDSVINQTHTNIEIIVIDDGSTDSSKKLIQHISETENRVQYHYQTNKGVSSARNLGIEKAKGKYLFFLDADDVWLPDNITLKVNTFKKDKTVDWIFGSIELVDENSNKLNSTLKGSSTDILNSLLTWNGEVITTPSTICIKSEIASNLCFDENLSTAADQDFAIQLAAQFKGAYFNTPTVLYRILPNSMSRNIALMEKDHLQVFKKAQQNNLFVNNKLERECFSNLYWVLAGSWWKDGNNKTKGFYFIIAALLTNPFSITRFIKSSHK